LSKMLIIICRAFVKNTFCARIILTVGASSY